MLKDCDLWLEIIAIYESRRTNVKHMDYKNTLNLPKTSFPMKADLPKKEPLMLEQWEKSRLYAKIQQERNSSPVFMLHDGPPYANGDIHMGHALNKILKDIVVRFWGMKGFRVPFVPGWDCHGLPVELQLFKELKKTKHDVDRLEFREKARAYASRFVNVQREQFKRLGILGDWDKPYLTMNFDYQASIMECFWKLYQKGYVYKGVKPIHWCPSCETALAEAEVEYEAKSSPSVYVKFPLTKESVKTLGVPENTSVLIWTTTPWTLPANVAIALRPEAEYSVLQVKDDFLIMASQLVPQVQSLLGWDSVQVLKTLKGREFDRLECQHPFINRHSLLILGEHVTLDQGTGCVHTAPGHGQEDYEIGLSYQLPILSPVNSKGEFTEEVELFKGQTVFNANQPICDLLRKLNVLLYQTKIEHSYPHCWRCKSPIIFRATKQWFLGVDRLELRQKSLEEIEKVRWIPAVGKNRISSMVQSRPDWCLSRQRLWGVPIPIFYCDHCETEFLDEKTIAKVLDAVRKNGASAWFKLSAEEFISQDSKCKKCGHQKFCKEEDIIDVWFDSGVSHHAVLKKFEALTYPADLYLEGSDQHRGWFQTSLLAAMGLCDQAPFKSVLTHGFVVDGEGKKMSKSAGNVIAPQEAMKEYGADILRLWVSSTDFSQDVRISNEILAQIADTYRKIRNTFRFLLGNLFDYDKKNHVVQANDLGRIDRWALGRSYQVLQRVGQAYESYEFCKIYHLVDQFCTVELSAFYFDILKDRLYTFPANSKERRSTQSVLYEILKVLNRILAPILPFTTEEVWKVDSLLGEETSSVHLAPWPDYQEYEVDPVLESKWELIQDVRSEVLKVLEGLRKEKVIGSSLEASVELLTDNPDVIEALQGLDEDLKTIFIVSQASLKKQSAPFPDGHHQANRVRGLGIVVTKALGEKCQRCWNYSTFVGRDQEHPSLCDRCVEAVRTLAIAK